MDHHVRLHAVSEQVHFGPWLQLQYLFGMSRIRKAFGSGRIEAFMDSELPRQGLTDEDFLAGHRLMVSAPTATLGKVSSHSWTCDLTPGCAES